MRVNMRLLPLVIVGFITYTLAAASDINSQAAPLKQRLAEKGGNIINYNSNVPKEQLSQNKERQQALLPYLVAAPKRGVIGTSRYADTLRRRIVKASRDKTR